MRIPVIAIFDVGKTNKKLFLFNERYDKVYEQTVQLKEAVDEDGEVCEHLALLTEWVSNSFKAVLQLPEFDIRAVNFSAYGASFVHIMEEGATPLPLYNYLKTYPPQLQKAFYDTYGGEAKIARETASPVAGNLNSGLQLYRIKKQQPAVFRTITCSLHLPQYLSFLITGLQFSDITSVGCHTSLWNFTNNEYHFWVRNEGIDKKLAPIKNGDEVIEVDYDGVSLIAGIGMHDSSAALIPYLLNFIEPFVLISTGTWCISLNPFNNGILTAEELDNNCLCYLQYKGLPVKASRLFAGYEHEKEVLRLADFFSKPVDYYKEIYYDEVLFNQLKAGDAATKNSNTAVTAVAAMDDSYETAYYRLMVLIVEQQVVSTQMILAGTPIKRIFVDGGFSKNTIYMNLLSQAFAGIEVFAASMPQATALGAALAIHNQWNKNFIPHDLIKLKLYGG